MKVKMQFRIFLASFVIPNRNPERFKHEDINCLLQNNLLLNFYYFCLIE